MFTSFLYGKNAAKCKSPYIRKVFSEVGLDKALTPDAADFFTDDIEIIKNRQEFFDEKNKGLFEAIEILQKGIKEYSEYRNAPKRSDSESRFIRGYHPIFYIELTDSMYAKLKLVESELHSSAAKEFAAFIINEAEGEEYKTFKQNIESTAGDIMQVKSITIGVNLNAQLRPKEAGLVSINDKPYKSGKFLDRLLRLDFVNDEFHTMAPMTTVSTNLSVELRSVADGAVLNVLETILRDSLKKTGAEINKYFYKKMTAYEVVEKEIKFLLEANRFLDELRRNNIPLCNPTAAEKIECHIKSLYHPLIPNSRTADRIIPNDVNFDKNGKIYILTGPNSGGKTVYVRAVAIAQLLFQLGLPVPARKAEMTPADEIYTFFPRDQSTKGGGRLEEECRELAQLLEVVSEKSLVLMDETFSSTSAKDGAILAESCLQKLRAKGSVCIFSTHIHELAKRAKDMNEEVEMENKIDLLAAEISGNVRTYRILRGYADGSSDAETIAKKYGLLS